MGEVVSYTKAGIEALIASAISSSGSATQADIDAAIAALVDGAPDLLNTLNEIAAAFNDDPNAITALRSGSMGVVIHAADANVARPAGYGAIHWIGSVAPTNAIDNDVWTDTNA